MENHKRIAPAAAAALTLLACGCNGGGDDDDQVQLEGFVAALIAETSDTTDPVPIEGQQFVFGEDPDAFDDIVQ